MDSLLEKFIVQICCTVGLVRCYWNYSSAAQLKYRSKKTQILLCALREDVSGCVQRRRQTLTLWLRTLLHSLLSSARASIRGRKRTASWCDVLGATNWRRRKGQCEKRGNYRSCVDWIDHKTRWIHLSWQLVLVQCNHVGIPLSSNLQTEIVERPAVALHTLLLVRLKTV